MDENNPVCWDTERRMLYWISREETGNGEHAARHYISLGRD